MKLHKIRGFFAIKENMKEGHAKSLRNDRKVK